jgi:hypothetical protein
MFIRSRTARPTLLATGLVLIFAAATASPAPRDSRPAAPRFRAGTLDPAIRESSGIVASRRHPGVFWTLSDSGNDAAVFAVERDGTLIREYAVAGAGNTDWEDLAIDDAGLLYIADTGNNNRRREQVTVLRVDEPDPRVPLNGARAPAPIPVTASWRLNYPGHAPFDCESLFVLDGKAYLLPKRLDGSKAEIFRFDVAADPAPRDAVTPARVAEVPAVRAPVTAADVSPDGKRLAILTVLGPYVLDIGGDVANAATAPARYSRYIGPKMEAACFVEGGLLVTSEERDVMFFADEHFKPVKP